MLCHLARPQPPALTTDVDCVSWVLGVWCPGPWSCGPMVDHRFCRLLSETFNLKSGCSSNQWVVVRNATKGLFGRVHLHAGSGAVIRLGRWERPHPAFDSRLTHCINVFVDKFLVRLREKEKRRCRGQGAKSNICSVLAAKWVLPNARALVSTEHLI